MHIITELSGKLYYSNASTDDIKLFLTDLFLRTREKLSLTEEENFPLIPQEWIQYKS